MEYDFLSVALKTIVAFSTSIEELLSRQKINKDVLFKYLVTNNVTPSVNTKKPELINEVMVLWSKKSQVYLKLSRSLSLSLQTGNYFETFELKAATYIIK